MAQQREEEGAQRRTGNAPAVPAGSTAICIQRSWEWWPRRCWVDMPLTQPTLHPRHRNSTNQLTRCAASSNKQAQCTPADTMRSTTIKQAVPTSQKRRP